MEVHTYLQDYIWKQKKQPHYTVLPNFQYHMLIYKVTIHKDAGGFMKPCKS